MDAVFPGDQPTPEAIVTLAFDGVTASGQGPCNQFSGPYTVDGTALGVGPLVATEVACPDLEIEQALFAALEATRSWTIQAGDLILLDDAGNELQRFARASTGD